MMARANPGPLSGQVVAITGASGGIGSAAAVHLAKAGASLVLMARGAQRLEQVAHAAAQYGVRTFVVPVDVTDEEAVERGYSRALDHFERLDGAVHAAGACFLGPVVSFGKDHWDQVLDVNLTGTFLCTRAAVRHMVEVRRGQVINLASYMGKVGRPTVSAYCASKFGVIGFSQAVAEEVRSQGVRVSVVCPREVDTPMRTDLFPHSDRSRWLAPDTIAEAILYLFTRPFLAGTEELVVGIPQG